VTATAVVVRRDTYLDSTVLMSATRAMEGAPGTSYASALMATPANLDALRAQGLDHSDLAGARANDLVLAVRAHDAEAAEAAIAAGQRALGQREPRRAAAPASPRTLEEALEGLPGANAALVSVPGDYAALEAHKALSAGLHVLLFSDNVSVEREVELKQRAESLGLLVMGPGAGTAIVAGTGLGFANAVRRGPVGVVSAAGTGAQEVSTLLHRWGGGVSQVIGTGGRDLSAEVGGLTTRPAARLFAEDPETEVVLVVSKPPAPEVARALLSDLAGTSAIAALIGFSAEEDVPGEVAVARTLEGGAALALAASGARPPDVAAGLAELVEPAAARLPADRRLVRGLFSGGTLCYEAMVVMSARIGAIHSNVPLRAGWDLPAPEGAHLCLDLGEEEFTKGRPHPMIDPAPRADLIAEAASDPAVGAILVDVVLGHGAHADPASLLAPACAEASADDGPAIVAYVLGTDADPQDLDAQTRLLSEAGCLLAPTAARAALLAAAVVRRRPEIAKEVP
jgi:FdrA protein